MAERELFDGEPVIQFETQRDRRNFLRYARIVGVGGALALAGVACADEEDPAAVATPAADPTAEPSPTDDTEPQVPQSDLDILNYALTLEYLEAEFYQKATQGNLLSGRDLALVTAIGAHEQAHVDALTQTINDLGGTPVQKPTFKLPAAALKDKAAFFATASTFEELGVDAYHGQVPEIQTPDLLAAAAAIAGVESRHAAVLALKTKGKPFPAPVEDSKSMEQVLEVVKPLIKA
ncbi:MAG: ferritin-like domain-containing protein [Actinomycetota bacterium]|nr:ferritin-like domain-containing protein [Actinomycetota bacterium]